MNGFLEVGSSIFLLPWVMVRRASRLRELLRQCAGLSCRSALRVKDHERGHRQDYYKPPNLLNTLQGTETRATRAFSSCG
jgi:hypothetical protein